MPELPPEQRLSITRHLAEKVMGREVCGDMMRVAPPVKVERIQPRQFAQLGIDWDPFTDANATLEVLKACDVRMDHLAGDQWNGYKLVRHEDDYGRIEKVWLTSENKGFCETTCLACAKATGWEG